MNVRLNLATKPFENHRPFFLGAGLAGFIAVLLFAVVGWNVWQSWKSNRDLRAEIAQLSDSMRTYRDQRRELEDFFKQPGSKVLMDRAAFLNGLIQQRSFPWTRIFSDLERRLPEGVRVVTIAPQMRDGRVHLKLVVGATTDEAKLKLLRALEQAPEFSSLQVVSESRGRDQDAVQLELAALYAAEIPALPVETERPAGPASARKPADVAPSRPPRAGVRP